MSTEKPHAVAITGLIFRRHGDVRAAEVIIKGTFVVRGTGEVVEWSSRAAVREPHRATERDGVQVLVFHPINPLED